MTSSQIIKAGDILEPQALVQRNHCSGEVSGAVPTVCGFRISPYVILFIFLFYSVSIGPAYMNFNAIRDVLLRDNVYAWKCENYSPGMRMEYINNVPEAHCEKQEISISFLFTVCSSSQFIFSCFAGIILDYVGPKATGMLGTTILFLGWLLLGLSSSSFQAFVPAFLLIGSGTDTATFASFCILAIFPGNENLILGCLGAMRSLSYTVTLLFRTIGYSVEENSARYASLCFMIVLMFISFLIAAFICPVSSWVPTKSFTANHKIKDLNFENEAKKSKKTDVSVFNASKAENCNNEKKEVQLVGITYNNSTDNTEIDIEHDENVSNDMHAAVIRHNSVVLDMSVDAWTKFQYEMKEILSIYSSLNVLFVIFYFILFLIVVVFFTPIADVVLPDIYRIHQFIQLLSVFPGPLLGILSDRTDIVYVMLLIDVSIFMMLFCAVVPHIPSPVPMQIASSIFFTGAMSFKMSQLYCFASSHIQSKHIGKFIGFSTLLGGISTLLNVPIQNYSRTTGNFNVVAYVFMSGIFIAFVLLCIVAYRFERGKK